MRRAGFRPALAAAIVALLAYQAAIADPTEEAPERVARDADYMAGKQALDRKDWAEATRRLQQVAVREPDNADIQNYLGYAYRHLKQFDAAFKHYKQALALNPRHRGAHEYIGEAYLMLGDLAGAEKHLAALRDICLLPCEELDDLNAAVVAFRAKPRASGATR
jgi:Flp pilus assembly protein TadD